MVEVRGDEVLAAFGSARAALRAATGLLARCADETTPDLPLRAGVGVDVGEPVAVPGGYRGEVINTAARLCAQAGPGEVLASEAAVALARRIDGLAYEDRGALALKGLLRPVRAWLVRAGAGADAWSEGAAAAPPSPAPPRHNLPSALSTFIGREQDRARVRELLAAHRLVTLAGSGGVGKTRLALAVAEDLLGAFPDGVWLVELAALDDPALLPGAVAQALGLREEPDRTPRQSLADHLREQHLLLLLDNCEHLTAACADLATALLRAGPAVRLLATSRQQLGVAGERRYRVPSLSVPDRRDLPSPGDAARFESVQLFVARAQEQRDDFALTERNARAVAEICARLDGVPLAIELAAARAGSMPVESIAARLHDRFRLLSGGARDLPARQRTLRAALDWSWDLLEEPERALLRRLAVFAGGWTLAAAEAVLGGEGTAAWAVLDGLDSLVGKSLVQVDAAREHVAGEEEGRYHLLESVHEYAGEQLARAGDAAQVRAAHLDWCLALAREAAPHLTGPDQVAWLARLETEHENLRAALRWAYQTRAAAQALRLSAALWRFWYLRGHLGEGRAWLDQALALAEGDAGAAGERALPVAAHGAGVLAWTQGDYALAEALAGRALLFWRAAGDQAGMAPTLNLLGLVRIDQGAWDMAATALEESLALHRASGNRWGIATVLHNLGTVARRRADAERAAALYEESLALRQALGDAAGMAISYRDRGMLALEHGEAARAIGHFRAGLDHAASLGDAVGLAQSLEGLAAVAARGDRPEEATGLLAAAAALRDRLSAPIAPADRAERERLMASLRDALGAGFDAAWAAGRGQPWERLVAPAES